MAHPVSKPYTDLPVDKRLIKYVGEENRMNCPTCNPNGDNRSGLLPVMPKGTSTTQWWAVKCPKGCDHGDEKDAQED
jgi:hypothetical protein